MAWMSAGRRERAMAWTTAGLSELARSMILDFHLLTTPALDVSITLANLPVIAASEDDHVARVDIPADTSRGFWGALRSSLTATILLSGGRARPTFFLPSGLPHWIPWASRA